MEKEIRFIRQRETEMVFTALPPLSLYVHIPWCVRKCPYCDFNSHTANTPIPEREYIDALLRDLENELPSIWGRKIETIFLGGGTPSLLSVDAVDQLLSGIRARIPVNPNAEITLEANPGTAEAEKFRGFREVGFNRISIGIQSFDSALLTAIGRIHDGDQAMKAVEYAQLAGFSNINLDLMFGLPGQSLDMAANDIDTAIQLKPTHLSYYQLTLEPNTLFYTKPPTLPSEDSCWDIQEQSKEKLAAAGFNQYEVSAYAQDRYQCRHNTNYWQFGDYIGIGAGAHGKITRADTQSVERYWKRKSPKDYLAGNANNDHVAETKRIEAKDIVFEFMLNALRLNAGFSLRQFEQRTGLPRSVVENRIEHAITANLIERSGDDVRATSLGLNFLNDLINRFL